MVADMTRSDIRWDDGGPEWDEDRLARLERHEMQTRIIENNNQMLVDVMKPWMELANVMEKKTQQEETERTIDCAIRYLEDAIHKNAFKEVRSAIHHLNEYMAERIEYLEERQEAEQPRFPAQFHRSSA
jgi:hypothetical protein